MTAKTTKVIIVDDHTLVANVLADLINTIPGFEVAHQFLNGFLFMEYIEQVAHLPDIILLDMNMPVMDGFETITKLKFLYPQLPVLVLSMTDDESSIIRMMRSGANGFISKHIREEELVKALKHISEEGYYYTDQVTKLVMTNFQKKDGPNGVILTVREKEFLSWACSDLTYKEIAHKMFVSPRTIDGYRDDLFLKLDVKSRTGLVLYAVRNKLVDIKQKF